LNLFNLLIKLGTKRIVYLSSGGAVYGNARTNPIDEEHPLNPISSYGIIKATTEMYLSLYQRLHGLKPLILRPSNPYGPRQGHYMAQGVISTFLKKIQKNEGITVYGDGNSTKDYIYINDLINLIYELTIRDLVGVFNLGSGIGTSVNQIIDQIKNITNSKPEINYIDKQSYDVDHFILDISKITNLLGTYQFTSLEEGISKTWYWLNSIT